MSDNILEPTINGLPPITDWQKVFLVLQQANEAFWRGATMKDFGKQIIGDIEIQGADFYDLPVATSSTPVALPIPTVSNKFGFLANGKYSQQSGGTLEYSATQWGLVLFDGTKWVKRFTLDMPTVQGVDVVVQGSSNLPTSKAVYDFVPLDNTGVNIYDRDSPDNVPNRGINNATGDIVTSTGAILSYPITVTENTQYACLNFGVARSIQFQNSSGAKLSFIVTNGVFTTPAGCTRLQFSAKLSSESSMPAGIGIAKGTSTEKITKARSGFKLLADSLVAGATLDGNKILSNQDIRVLNNDLSKVKSTNLFDRNSTLIEDNKAVNASGDIGTFSGYKLSHPIAVEPNSLVGFSGLTPGTRNVQFQDKNGLKVGYFSGTSAFSSIFTPANCYRMQFTIKFATETDIPPIEVFTYNPVTTLAFEGKIVVPLGDSITVANNYATYRNFLRDITKASDVKMKGLSGQSFAGQLQSDDVIQSVIDENPSLVLIHGVNDHRTSRPIGALSDTAGSATYLGGLKKIVERLIAHNKNVKIIFCTPIPYGRVTSSPSSDEPNSLGLRSLDYANAMRNLADMYSIPVVDFSRNLPFRPSVEGSSERVYTSDGVHPIDTGYRPMTNLVGKGINAWF
ncbi:SGNH/GDSL hydrolase family protein [Sphingobacterium sp. HSC-15S19]|uniref:SGNH/GDSL hydrolase family protein n=1 Tax=Sphingobacterium sp. HSC-15S19 TaxID=2910971 RepID=UPI003D1ADBF3